MRGAVHDRRRALQSRATASRFHEPRTARISATCRTSTRRPPASCKFEFLLPGVTLDGHERDCSTATARRSSFTPRATTTSPIRRATRAARIACGVIVAAAERCTSRTSRSSGTSRGGSSRCVTCSARPTPSRCRMAELLALADDDARERWDSLRLGYTESLGLPGAARGDRVALSGPRRRRRHHVRRRRGRRVSRDARAARTPAITRSSSGRRISRCTRSRGRSARRSRSFRSIRATGRSTSTPSRRRCGRTRASSSSTFRTARPARSSSRDQFARLVVDRRAARRASVLRRGVSVSRAQRAARSPPAAERSERAHQPRRDVEGVRPRRRSHRLDRDARSRAARAARGAQGLHDDLQRAPSEILALIALRARETVSRAHERDHSRQSRDARRVLRAQRRAVRVGPAARRQRRAFPSISAATSTSSRPSSSSAKAC